MRRVWLAEDAAGADGVRTGLRGRRSEDRERPLKAGPPRAAALAGAVLAGRGRR
jgi:hypothetical protein